MKYQDLAKPNNLKKLREEKGVSQTILAFACFQSASKISFYENGKRMPAYLVLRLIARFLEVSIEKIYPSLLEIDKEADMVKEILKNKGKIRSR